MPTKSLDRLIYIDDSGDTKAGLVVYGWVEFRPDQWHDVLGQWLQHRKRLWKHFGVPVHKELHMTKYALGRGELSSSPPERFIRPGGGSPSRKILGAK